MPYELFKKTDENEFPRFKISRRTCKTSISKCSWLWSRMLQISQELENISKNLSKSKKKSVKKKENSEEVVCGSNQSIQNVISKLGAGSPNFNFNPLKISEDDESAICDSMLNVLNRSPRVFRKTTGQSLIGLRETSNHLKEENTIQFFEGRPLIMDEEWMEEYQPEAVSLSWIINDELVEARNSF